MEKRFGRDFGEVRIHEDDESRRAAATLGAAAFTVGRDIYLGTAASTPAIAEGRRLITHELAHVVQQEGASGTWSGSVSTDRTVEREADRAAGHALAGHRPQELTALPTRSVQRQGV